MKEFLFENCFAIVGLGLLIFGVGIVYIIAKQLIEASGTFIKNQIEEDEN